MTDKSKQLWVRLDPEDYERIVVLARKYRVAVSTLARMVLTGQARIDDPTRASVPGLYVPDPETAAGAAELDQVDDDDDQESDPGPVPGE